MSKWITASFSNTGKRENNEDSWTVLQLNANTTLLMVCDGVGGNIGGEVASDLVCKGFSNYLLQNPPSKYSVHYLQEAINYCHEILVQHVNNNPQNEGMSTTLVFCIMSIDKGFWIGHIGDSRFYHLVLRHKQYKVKHCTIDHNLTGPAVAAGKISELEARFNPNSSTLTRCLTGSKDYGVRADIFQIKKLNKGDIIFLCSDGVLESYTSTELAIALSSQTNFTGAFKNIERVCEKASNDNYTAVGAYIINDIPSIYNAKVLLLRVILPLIIFIGILFTVFYIFRPKKEESLIKDSILDKSSRNVYE
ncbi:MAG: PP2C family protein-serine/threonine phosphatase [Bacteroidia bacterium]|jgi:serine/threonine protein phosphatase PrpC